MRLSRHLLARIRMHVAAVSAAVAFSLAPVAPAVGAEDLSAWRGELPLRLVRDFPGADIPVQPGLLPVDVHFTLKAVDCSAPER